MASLTAIRDGLASNLDGIADLQVSPYVLSAPTPPAAEIMPAEIDYDVTMARGIDRWKLVVRVFVGFTTDIGAQKRLDKMIASSGTDSVKAKVESDRTLGGAAHDVRVTGCSGYRIFRREGQAPVIGAEWEVEVLAGG